MKPGRNARCPCGSGLKFKRCCEGKQAQPVSYSVVNDLGEGRAVGSVALNWGGSIGIAGAAGDKVAPQNFSMEISRSRNSDSPKPKVLNFASGMTGKPTISPDQILGDFSRIFVVDTNYPKEGWPKSITLTSVLLAEPHFEVPMPYLRLGAVGSFEFRNVTCEPERLGWMQALESIRRSPGYSASRKFLLLVDSQLGDLPAINARTQPILDDYLLPEGFTLAYASADTGREYVVNQLMHECDKLAKDMLRRIGEGLGEPTDLQPANSPHASHFRLWVHD